MKKIIMAIISSIRKTYLEENDSIIITNVTIISTIVLLAILIVLKLYPFLAIPIGAAQMLIPLISCCYRYSARWLRDDASPVYYLLIRCNNDDMFNEFF